MTRPAITEERQIELEDIKGDIRRSLFRAIRSAFKHESQESCVKARDIAASIGSDPAYVSRVLKGNTAGITAETAAVFLDALGYELRIDKIKKCDLALPNLDCRVGLPPKTAAHFKIVLTSPLADTQDAPQPRNDSKAIKLTLEPAIAR